MVDHLANSSVYTDLSRLQALKQQAGASKNAQASPQVTKEVAKQFEAILLQFALKGMRDANRAISSDLLSSNQSGFYQDLHDKQLALVMSQRGIGLSSLIERQLDPHQKKAASSTPIVPTTQIPSHASKAIKQYQLASLPQPMATQGLPPPQQTQAVEKIAETTVAAAKPKSFFTSKLDFLKGLLDEAVEAGKLLGVNPKVLLAQAALETAWGKRIIKEQDGSSSHNVFGIKADKRWNKDTATVTTHEFINGKKIKQKAAFRSYDSYLESFLDYASFLKDNSRYKSALKVTEDAFAFTKALQKAGYATDPNYAGKINRIINSPLFKSLFGK